MRFTYDKEVDALAIKLTLGGKGEVTSDKRAPGEVTLAYDKAGNMVGVQVLNASTHYDPSLLAGLEAPVTWLSLAEAEKDSGISVSGLRSQIVNGKLKGEKRGRDWVVALHELHNYLERRDARGRPAVRRKARRAKPATR